MRHISAAMQALLSSDAIPAFATFWLVTRKDGVQLGFTDWTNNITVGTITYEAAAGGSRSAIQQRVDLAVPVMEITSILESDSITDEDVRAGKYDGASIKAFMAVPTDADFLTYGQILLPGAYMGEVKLQNGVYVAELRGLTYALTQSFIEVYTPTCRADFCDARCTLNPASFTVNGHITSVISANQQFTASVGPVAGTNFQFGVVTFTSGRNSGYAVEIETFDGTLGTITTYLPVPFALHVNDQVSIISGCDKTINTCTSIYNNAINFRGEPFIPGANFLFDYGQVAP